jgi:hypothetical protein
MIKQTWQFDARGPARHEVQEDDLDTLRQDIEERLAQLLAESGRADLLSLAMRAGTLGVRQAHASAAADAGGARPRLRSPRPWSMSPAPSRWCMPPR